MIEFELFYLQHYCNASFLSVGSEESTFYTKIKIINSIMIELIKLQNTCYLNRRVDSAFPLPPF